MTPHRYWRARLVAARDLQSDITISEFALLWAKTRIDSAATLTSSAPPLAGSLANLKDNDLDTDATFAPGTVLEWDFGGSPVAVGDIRVGSAGSRSASLLHVQLEHSDDGSAWSLAEDFFGISWPGARSWTSSRTIGWDNFIGSNYLATYGDPASVIVQVANTSAVSKRSRDSGVLQFEVEITSLGAPIEQCRVGICVESYSLSNNSPDSHSGVWAYGPSNNTSFGAFIDNGSSSLYGDPYETGDTIGVVVDFPAGELEFFKNGVSQGVVTPSGFASEPVIPRVGKNRTTSVDTNFLLRLHDFSFPVAGADPWEPNDRIATGPVTAFVTPLSAPLAPPDTAYSGARLIPFERAKADFRFDPRARGRIIGTVKEKGTPSNTPLRRRVRLFRDVDGMLIRETWSDAAGNYSFDNIEEGMAYTVISYDYEHIYRPAVADNLTLANGGLELIE